MDAIYSGLQRLTIGGSEESDYDREVKYFIESREKTWIRQSVRLQINDTTLKFSEVYRGLEFIFSCGWILVGSAALHLLQGNQRWSPADLDFFLVEDYYRGDPVGILRTTIYKLDYYAKSNGIAISYHILAGIVDVVLCADNRSINLQFVLAVVPNLEYLLYNFDTPVSSVAITSAYTKLATLTPFTATCIATNTIPLHRDLVDDRADSRTIKYFRRGFNIRVCDLHLIHFLKLNALLVEGVLKDNCIVHPDYPVPMMPIHRHMTECMHARNSPSETAEQAMKSKWMVMDFETYWKDCMEIRDRLPVFGTWPDSGDRHYDHFMKFD